MSTFFAVAPSHAPPPSPLFFFYCLLFLLLCPLFCDLTESLFSPHLPFCFGQWRSLMCRRSLSPAEDGLTQTPPWITFCTKRTTRITSLYHSWIDLYWTLGGGGLESVCFNWGNRWGPLAQEPDRTDGRMDGHIYLYGTLHTQRQVRVLHRSQGQKHPKTERSNLQAEAGTCECSSDINNDIKVQSANK